MPLNGATVPWTVDDDVPDLDDGFTSDQRRVLTVLASGTKGRMRTMRSDRVLALALEEPAPSLEPVLRTGAWRTPRDRHLAAYRTLVELAQPFTTRYPLVIGTGNFGTRDDEPPADAVFTRCQVSALGAAALVGLVHPLLLNGAAARPGVRAIGCLPHNLGDVLTAARGLLADPTTSDDELVDRWPGPDFPTGGVLGSRSDLRALYRTGAGRLPVRGRATVVESPSGPAVVVSELPFTVTPAAFLGELTDGMISGGWPEIADLLDQTDQRELRIVLVVRAGTAPERLLAELFARTSLAITLEVEMVARVDGVAQRVTLPALLRAYLRRLTSRRTRPATLSDKLAALARTHGDARRTDGPAP